MGYPTTIELQAIMARMKTSILDAIKFNCMQGAGMQALAVSELFFAVECAPRGILDDAMLDGCARNIVKGIFLLLDSNDPDGANDVLGVVQELLIACDHGNAVDAIMGRIERNESGLDDLRKMHDDLERENE